VYSEVPDMVVPGTSDSQLLDVNNFDANYSGRTSLHFQYNQQSGISSRRDELHGRKELCTNLTT
jgi:hypothetical protein